MFSVKNSSVCFEEDFLKRNSLEIDTEFETKESNFILFVTEIYEFVNFSDVLVGFVTLVLENRIRAGSYTTPHICATWFRWETVFGSTCVPNFQGENGFSVFPILRWNPFTNYKWLFLSCGFWQLRSMYGIVFNLFHGWT